MTMARAALVALVLLVAGTACEMDVDVTVDATAAGSGSVQVAVGFDEAALARLGDPATALATDDLAAAGWAVDPASVTPDGMTRIVATKTFDDPAGFATAVDEVAGPAGPLTGTSLTVTDEALTYLTTLTGVVDLSAGLAPYTDPALDAAADGVPLGGLPTAVEEAEGRPVADMVDVTVTWRLDGTEVRVEPVLGAPAPPPTVLSVERPRVERRALLAAGVVVVAVVVVGAVHAIAVRRRRASG